ncbi:C-GCAxxG-C-C family protein [Spirochaeta isovalerica]|uniref:C_GCAxxG_C_C family probable redox protein n=1 Tax=Spirochaeta isovalerica TaxID=150 RepID=A0A841RBY7_9SPIO|nr:C-GCAxxG-C-C family protein [Spirochaeta isovalerica]MBB6481453.1 C_GCAxxG_C_C family probable redox protein [Spirochaeta isovalerica]
MVSELIENGFGDKDREDYSCSERILYGSNEVYNLGLDKESLKMAAGLSGGIYSRRSCGAVTASAMVLAKLFVKDRAHEGDYHKELISELVSRYEEEMGSSLCQTLLDEYRTEQEGCRRVIIAAARILDDIINRELNRK